jgi:hypothetical protein
MNGLNKLNIIADLLDGKGIILVRSDEVKGQWFVHCWRTVGEDGYKDIHRTYTTDPELELDVIIEKLGGNPNE